MWKCPECETGYEDGKGLVCECENGAGPNHGEDVNDPCTEARCSKCGWCGSLPADRDTIVGKMIKDAFVGEEYDRVLKETQRYFANETAMAARGMRAIISFATLKRLLTLAGEEID